MIFEIQGKPVAWKRPGRNGNVYFDTQKACKRKMVAAVKSVLGESGPTRLPLYVDILFSMPIPKSWNKKRREYSFSEPHAVRPDLDNLVKFVLDALNGVLWEDDAQISVITTSKNYAKIPKTRISLKRAPFVQYERPEGLGMERAPSVRMGLKDRRVCLIKRDLDLYGRKNTTDIEFLEVVMMDIHISTALKVIKGVRPFFANSPKDQKTSTPITKIIKLVPGVDL